jgi:hypothetical protein
LAKETGCLFKKKHQITNLNNTPKAHKELVGSNNKEILSLGKETSCELKKTPNYPTYIINLESIKSLSAGTKRFCLCKRK